MSSETLFAQTAHRAYAASVAAFVPRHRLDVPRARSVIVFCFALLAGAYVTLQRHSGVTTLPEELKPPGNIFFLEKISFSWTH